MNKPSELLIEMFTNERWETVLKKAEDKGLDRKLIHSLESPEERQKLFVMIYTDSYNIFPPHIAKIPKDKPGEFREVYINTDRDRIVLSLINDCLADMFSDMVHPQCKSYQSGTSTQKVVKQISNEIIHLDNSHKLHKIGVKSDFSKYFDTVKIEYIDKAFETVERKLDFEKGTEPVMNLLRRYYHQDIYFDSEGNLQERYQSLKQGCAVASWLANVLLYDLDEYMSNKYAIYYRYSDDCVCIDRDTSHVVDDMNKIIKPYGVTLNPKKVEDLYSDKWFKFLGFNIKGSMITLSKNRVKKFQNEVEKRSIKKKKCSGAQARKSIIKYLYEGEYCWATSCLGTINVEHDLEEMNGFIMDCIRACETGKKKIGGLGSCMDKEDYTIVRGRGRHVSTNSKKVVKIENYLTVKCLSTDLKMSKEIFETVVRSL